jgi:hypothetical protein
VHGVKRETVAVPPMQRQEGPSIRSWLEASGPPQNPGVGFLSEDLTKTYGAQAEVKKWREFLKGLRDDPVDLATLLMRMDVNRWIGGENISEAVRMSALPVSRPANNAYAGPWSLFVVFFFVFVKYVMGCAI